MKAAARLFSGIQPSGSLHLGNYLGAIQNWVRLTKEYEKPIFCLVDLHSLTSVPRSDRFVDVQQRLHSHCFELAVALLACGLDPDQCILYRQSSIPYHAHIQWILACRTRLSSLELMTQFKSKSSRTGNGSNCGLFTYPVLMAADILLVGFFLLFNALMDGLLTFVTV